MPESRGEDCIPDRQRSCVCRNLVSSALRLLRMPNADHMDRLQCRLFTRCRRLSARLTAQARGTLLATEGRNCHQFYVRGASQILQLVVAIGILILLLHPIPHLWGLQLVSQHDFRRSPHERYDWRSLEYVVGKLHRPHLAVVADMLVISSL